MFINHLLVTPLGGGRDVLEKISPQFFSYKPSSSPQIWLFPLSTTPQQVFSFLVKV
jgi:hypothetical protein